MGGLEKRSATAEEPEQQLPLVHSKHTSPISPSTCHFKWLKEQLSKWFYIAAVIVVTLWWMTVPFSEYSSFLSKHKKHHHHHHHHHQEASCPQVPALRPHCPPDNLKGMDEVILSDRFRELAIDRLSGAVQIPTESFDNMGPVGEDSRWDVFPQFTYYLASTFENVHRELHVEKINEHGLLYTWQGTNSSLKPILLMAHQDVVPVPNATINSWTYPPFSGHYDGKYIWGRGASDCKNQLVGILEAMEEFILYGFKPRRTILLSFGFDEEISGRQGAARLAETILDRYGKEGIAAIVDEGAGFAKQWGMKVALPGVGEKGYTDVEVDVRMPGGHSSIPPDHTGIGVMSELISLVEGDKYEAQLADTNPYLGLLTCGAEHAPVDSFPKTLRKLLKKRFEHGQSQGRVGESDNPACLDKKKKKKHKHKHHDHKGEDRLALEAAEAGPAIRYLMQTSIAADVINGGVKNNALPERTSAIINHRVNIGEQTSDVHSKMTRHAEHIAKKYNLTLHAFEDNGNQSEPERSIILCAGKTTLEPAPVSPTSSSLNNDTITPWDVLSGTIRALYGEDVVVAPGLMTGNTDTRYYWDVSKNIYRFTAGWDDSDTGLKNGGLGNIHTVDERVSVTAHINMIRWMSLWVRNMDEAVLEGET